MKVFIAVASGETQHVKSYRTCLEITRRSGDEMFVPDVTSYGTVTRTGLLDVFRRLSHFDAALFLDADQAHPRDLLEKLRDAMDGADLDMVCAHYYRRDTRDVESLCWELGDGTWPFFPLLDPPTEGLLEIAATGLGCVLIRRRVIEAVWDTLPEGDNPFRPGLMPEVGGSGREFGSDVRFFLMARRLGYRLWLRADVESLHAVTVWMGHKTAAKFFNPERWHRHQKELFIERLRLHGMTSEAFKQRLRLLEARKRGMKLELDSEIAQDHQGEAMGITIALHQMDGRMAECQEWVEWLEKYPRVEYPNQLPGGPVAAHDPSVAQARYEARQGEALELVGELPDVGTNGAH